MFSLRRALSTIAVSAVLSLSLSLITAAPAAAYGSDAVYQIEVSFNCNSPRTTFCQQTFGAGGAWGWIELDSETHPGTSGDADIVIAFCGHDTTNIGTTQPPYGGAGEITEDGTWFSAGGLLFISSPTLGVVVLPAEPGHYAMVNDPVVGATAVIQVVKIPGR